MSAELTTAHVNAYATGRWAEIIFRALSSRVASRWQFISADERPGPCSIIEPDLATARTQAAARETDSANHLPPPAQARIG